MEVSVCYCARPVALRSRDSFSNFSQEVRNPVDPFMNARVAQKTMEWPTDGQNLYNGEPVGHMEVCCCSLIKMAIQS